MTDHTEGLPIFPHEYLPDAVRDYVVYVSKSTQASIDLAATSALAVISAATSHRAKVRVTRVWQEPINLYAACVLPAGDRKSPVVDAFRRTLLRNDEETDYPSFLFNNGTPASIAVEMAANGGRAAVIESDGNFLDCVGMQESSSFQGLLRAAGGERFASGRLGEPLVIEHPSLTILSAPQREMFRNKKWRSPALEPLLARFLWSMPLPLAGKRDPWPVVADDGSENRFKLGVQDLMRSSSRRTELVSIDLDHAASRAFEDFVAHMEARLRPESGDLRAITPWAAKASGRTLRIAGLLHAFLCFGDGAWRTIPIQRETMEAAIRIVEEWAIPHALAVYKAMHFYRTEE